MFILGIFKQILCNKSTTWRNLGFIKNNIKEQYSQLQINSATRNTRNYPKSHECYVPPKHNDFHAQIHCLLNDLLQLQKEKRGIKWIFTIDGGQTVECQLFFPVLFFAGDTMEHNKLSSLWGGSMGKFPCWLCNTTRNNLSSPQNVSLEKMTKGSKMKVIQDTNCTALKALGYYACQTNVLYDLQYCDIAGGLNHALPPDILHAVLLGFVTRLFNGFTRLKKRKRFHACFFRCI